jgi:hypothetical protein
MDYIEGFTPERICMDGGMPDAAAYRFRYSINN